LNSPVSKCRAVLLINLSRPISIHWLSLFLFVLTANLTNAQNLYDAPHSAQFAEYLFKTGQYQYAANEYERVIFLSPDSQQFKLMLIKSYRLAGDCKHGLLSFNRFFNISTLNADLSGEYLKTLILCDSIQRAQRFLATHNYQTIRNGNVYQAGMLMLDKRWTESKAFIQSQPTTDSIPLNELLLLTESALATKHKSPVVAATMSAIIPGTGKIYAGQWKDGAIALLFVAGNVWQSYRGFHKFGNKSAYGWIFAGLSAGFYIGNIYGSVKTAQRYNRKNEDKAIHHTLDILGSDF